MLEGTADAVIEGVLALLILMEQNICTGILTKLGTSSMPETVQN